MRITLESAPLELQDHDSLLKVLADHYNTEVIVTKERTNCSSRRGVLKFTTAIIVDV